MVVDEDIQRIVTSQPNLDKACSELIAAANAAGGKDNISVILARVEEPD